MKNITTFLSKNSFKPELGIVYVHEIEGVKYAVATDSFRLVEEKLPILLQEKMPCGYYQAKAYAEIVKEWNKSKQDIIAIVDTIQAQTAIQERYKDYNYPEYRQIIPLQAELVAFDSLQSFNVDYFKDFLSLMDCKNKHFSFENIKSEKNGRMIVYRNDDITLVLMALNK